MTNVLNHYKFLHTIPELGHKEYKTAAYLADKLEALGFTVTRSVGGSTGVIGYFDSCQPGPVLGLRADMDALGSIVDGKVQANHTCGHDAHSSMVLAATEELVSSKSIIHGKLKILFQPAEEVGTGALSLIDAGAIDDVDIILGQHLRPIQEMSMGKAAPAVYYSASAKVTATIKGKTAHGARPHLGVNAIDAATAAVTAVNAIQTDPNIPCSAKATRFICDTSVTNVIPHEATVTWDLRSRDNATMDLLTEKVQQAIRAGAATVGATAETSLSTPMPAAEFDTRIIDILSESITEALGAKALHPPIQTPGSEDFNFFKKRKPTIEAGFIGLGCGLVPGLHHPDMHFELSAMDNGVKILVTAAKKILG